MLAHEEGEGSSIATETSAIGHGETALSFDPQLGISAIRGTVIILRGSHCLGGSILGAPLFSLNPNWMHTSADHRVVHRTSSMSYANRRYGHVNVNRRTLLMQYYHQWLCMSVAVRTQDDQSTVLGE